MARVMAVSFERHGRLYYVDAGDLQVVAGEAVLFPTESGSEVARCVWGPTDVAWDSAGLPSCPGRATAEDLARDADNRRERAGALVTARELVAQHGLPMTIVAVDFLDRETDVDRLCAVYFRAPHRVDFRALLGDLARALRSRIDLRQIGARDVAAVLGGTAECGREFCCALMRPAPEPLNPRLARVQELPANPLQLAGGCGRMRCCVAYEHSQYVEFLDRVPAVGVEVVTPEGEGVVVGHQVPAGAVLVRTERGVVACPAASVALDRPSRRQLLRLPRKADA